MSFKGIPTGRFNLLARLEAKGEKEADEIADILRRVVERANSDEEPNTLYYKAHRLISNPLVFVVYEEYDNKGSNIAMDEHRAGKAFQELTKLVPTHTNGLQIEFMSKL